MKTVSGPIPSDKPIAMCTLGEVIGYVIAAIGVNQPHDAPMTAAQIGENRPGVTARWLRTHVAEAGRGARRMPLYRLADVDAALASAARPPRPARLKSRELTGVNVDALQQMIDRGELKRVGGGR